MDMSGSRNTRSLVCRGEGEREGGRGKGREGERAVVHVCFLHSSLVKNLKCETSTATICSRSRSDFPLNKHYFC